MELLRKLGEGDITPETAASIAEIVLQQAKRTELNSVFSSSHYDIVDLYSRIYDPVSHRFLDQDKVVRDLVALMTADTVVRIKPSRITRTDELFLGFAVSFDLVETFKGTVEKPIVIDVHSPAQSFGVDVQNKHMTQKTFLYLARQDTGWRMIGEGEYLDMLLLWYRTLVNTQLRKAAKDAK